MQNYFYDLHDQLVKAEIFKKDGTKETWSYTYDALGRRIGKGRLKNEEVSDNLEEETGFVWDGSHLLQEVHSDASVLAKTGKAASTTVQTVGKVVNYADDANDIAHTVTAMQDDPLGAALQFGIGRAIGHGSNVLGNKARARFGKGGSGADVDLPSSGKGVDLPAGNAGLKTHADTDVDPSTLGTGKKPKPEIQTPQHQEIPSPSKKPELDVTKTSKPEIDRASSPAVDKTNSKPSEIDTGKTVKPEVSQARPSEVASPNSRPKEVDVTKKPDIEASRPAEVNPTKVKPEMETKVKPDIEAVAASASAVPKVKAQEPDLPKAGQPEVTPDAGKKVQKPEEVDTEATKAGKVEEIGDADKKVKPKPKIIDGKEYITFRRVQGGGSGTATSQERIGITEDGQIIINKKDKNLNISINNGEHAAYYLDNRRTGGDVVEFEVPKWFYDFSDKYTISQVGYKKNPDNQGGMAPKETDLDTEGRSYEMPAPWSEWIEEHAINGRIIEGNEWKKMMGFNNKGGGS